MEEIEPTWKHALIVWWALTWKGLALGIPILILLTIVSSHIVVNFEIAYDEAAIFIRIIGFIVGLTLSLWLLKGLLSYQFTDFRITIVKAELVNKKSEDA